MSDWDTKLEESGIDSYSVKKKMEEFNTKKLEMPILYSDADVKSWTEQENPESKFCTLVYGADGAGKTGLVFDLLDYMDPNKEGKMWVIDLDGGGAPLKNTYHNIKKDRLTVINPLVTTETEEGTTINYQGTFAKIRAIIRYVKNNHKKEKIIAIVFDGLSTALQYAEQQMRLDKNIDVDGGVMLKYWLIRNKVFLETLEQCRTIPIAKFFIAHENFMSSDDPKAKVSSIIAKTNAMMIQKIRCQRLSTPVGVDFVATIDKNKYNVKSEGERTVFCSVNKDKTFRWNTQKIFELLQG